MKLFEIKKELELENDLLNLSREELSEKYGSDIRRSVVLIINMIKLLRQNPFYSPENNELYEKLEQVIGDIKDSSDSRFVTARAESLLNKMEKQRELNPEDGYADTELLELNFNLGIGAFNCPGMFYESIIKILNEGIIKLDSLGKQSSDLPDLRETKRIFNKSLKSARNSKYISLTEENSKIDDIYSEYPMMNLCYDKNFLVLTNYIIKKGNLDEDDMVELLDISKRVIAMSKAIQPVERINGEVDLEEYNRLAHFTSRNIKQYEEKALGKIKVKKRIFK